MGPCFCISFVVVYLFLRSNATEPCVSRPVLQCGRFMTSAALLIFWVGQIFVQLGSSWSGTSSASQLLYTDDITSWSWDRDVSFAATALTFVLLAPIFKPLECEGLHALVDSWLCFNVSSKNVLAIFHCVGCFCACAWAGFGPTLLILPVPFLASLGLIKCAHQQHRMRIASALSCYIVLLQLVRTLALSCLLAIADSFAVRFDIFFQVGLTSTEITTPAPNKFVYDSFRHVLLLFLGWVSCLFFSIERGTSDIAPSHAPQAAIELVAKRQPTVMRTAGVSLLSWMLSFSAESLRFCACIIMYFVGLAQVDAIHAVIFLISVMFKPLILLLKFVTKSKPKANLWLWSALAGYTTTLALFFVVFNVPLAGAPPSTLAGLGLQQDSLSSSWSSLLPILFVMCICSLLTAHSHMHIEVNSRKLEAKNRSAMKHLQQPLLSSIAFRDTAARTVGREAEAPERQPFYVSAAEFLVQLYDFYLLDYFRLSVSLCVLLRGMGVLSVGRMSCFRFGYLVIVWMLVSVVAFHQQWNGNAAKWTKRVWTVLNVYACFVIGIRYIYLVLSNLDIFISNKEFEVDIGLNRYTEISNKYLYFLTDTFLVALSFIQSRRFLKLQKSKWEWPESPPRFCFPRTAHIAQNLISVHCDKFFLISLIAACLVNGVSLVGWIWAVFFIVVVLSRSALESSWTVALLLSMLYCTAAALAPMHLVAFPNQVSNSTDPCDTNCLIGFIGFQSVTPNADRACPNSVPPFYCQEIQNVKQIAVSVCIAISAALMRLGTK